MKASTKLLLIQAASIALGCATIPAAHGADSISIPMTRIPGPSFTVPVSINGQWLPCVLDTGADVVVLPADWHAKIDATGVTPMRNAEGSVQNHIEGRMDVLQVGEASVRNVSVVIGTGDCLLGQSWLSRFASVKLDYVGKRLVLERNMFGGLK